MCLCFRLTTYGALLVISCYFIEFVNAKTPKGPTEGNNHEDEQIKGIKEYFQVIKNYKNKHRNKNNEILDDNDSEEVEVAGNTKEVKFNKKFRTKGPDESNDKEADVTKTKTKQNNVKSKDKISGKDIKKNSYSNDNDDEDDVLNADDEPKETKQVDAEHPDDISDEDNNDGEKQLKKGKKKQRINEDNNNGRKLTGKATKVNSKKQSDESHSDESDESSQSCRKKSGSKLEESCDEDSKVKGKKKMKYSIKFAHEKQKMKTIEDDYILKKLHKDNKRKR